MAETELYGLMVEMTTPEALVAAAEQASAAGYTQLDAFTPFPVEGLAATLGLKRTRIPLVTLLAGLTGGATAYFMQWYSAVVAYPLNVGGRPLHSAPAFIPITFELTVLFAAFGAVLSLLLMNRFPEPYHPVFNVERFARASQDRFFLCIEARDPRFDRDATRRFLEGLGGEGVHDVER